MLDIKELYKSVIMQGYYDEQYGMNPQVIDEKSMEFVLIFHEN